MFSAGWLALTALVAAPPTAGELPEIVVLGTGGTIAGRGVGDGPVGYTAATVGVDALIDTLPQLARIAQVRGEQVLQLPSQEMLPAHWLTLARRLQAVLDEPRVDGVVITHGTDTLEETAFFLHLVIRSAKPVVLVGAMRPVTALSADGPFNLYEAVLVAGRAEARGQGVLVLLDDVIHSARDVTKANTSRQDAFKSPEIGALGSVEGDRVYFYRAPVRAHTLASAFDIRALETLPEVGIAYAYAGAWWGAIDALAGRGVRGIVVAGVGNGNVNAAAGVALDRARGRGLAVVRGSRVGSGNIARNDEINDDQRGFVVADNLLPQKARVLLMLGLTKTRDAAALQALFDSH